MEVWERCGLENIVETFACGSCSYSISRSPKFPVVFLRIDRKNEKWFLFLKCKTLRSTSRIDSHVHWIDSRKQSSKFYPAASWIYFLEHCFTNKDKGSCSHGLFCLAIKPFILTCAVSGILTLLYSMVAKARFAFIWSVVTRNIEIEVNCRRPFVSISTVISTAFYLPNNETRVNGVIKSLFGWMKLL